MKAVISPAFKKIMQEAGWPTDGVEVTRLLPTGPAPVRIQRKRTKGWRKPPNTVFVGRPTKWGNPYRVGTVLIPDRAAAVAAFEANLPLGPFAQELRGKNLACWCPLDDQPCHADVLLKIANKEIAP